MKCVFYLPEHNTKGGPNEIEFSRSWNAKKKNIITDRAQRRD